ncbi:MAG: glycosyltransferase [Thermoanaerobaculia bacterium]|nr:glycosyltransferase [Thermoanaerobaculia bacterium]
MNSTNTMVSVCMAAYNHEKFIAKAIESVLMQETGFHVELVIGEDCSKDSTRAICEKYAAQYPDRIRLLPSDVNWGMSKNGIRILNSCRGKYIAILDGDDFWSDPHKLRDQVQFLEQNPDYGLIYTDVDAVNDAGEIFEAESIRKRRKEYREGEVFFAMLPGLNFINSCTALFRKELLELEGPNPVEKYWYSYDFWYWLRVSMLTKVAFLNRRMACYRMHEGGITNTAYFKNNLERNYYVLFDVIDNFYRRVPGPLDESDRSIIFRKLLSLLYRKQGTLAMKFRALTMLPRYFPGLGGITGILRAKTKRLSPTTLASKTAH